jgi:hypothetical protein
MLMAPFADANLQFGGFCSAYKGVASPKKTKPMLAEVSLLAITHVHPSR